MPALIALVALACDRNSDTASAASGETRFKAGDTLVVRSSGIGNAEFMLSLKREVSLGDSALSPGRDLTSIVALYPTASEGAFVAESQLRVRLFDSTGRFVRAFGARGSGPGEFIAPMSIAQDDKGRVYLQVLPRKINVYDSLGASIASVATPAGPPRQWYVSPNGDVMLPATVATRDLERGVSSEERRVIRIAAGDRKRDTLTIAPAPFGASLAIPRNYGNGETYSYTLPMSPQFLSDFGPPGTWAYGNSEQYRINILEVNGKILRIETDASQIVLRDDERRALADRVTAEMRMTDPQASLTPEQLPGLKPFFKSLRRDADGRIWVQLYQKGELVKQVGCPANVSAGGFSEQGFFQTKPSLCSDSLPPRSMDVLVEPTAYDVFEQTGAYVGRVALPSRTMFLNARSDIVWLQELDDDDVPTVTRYRIQVRSKAAVRQP